MTAVLWYWYYWSWYLLIFVWPGIYIPPETCKTQQDEKMYELVWRTIKVAILERLRHKWKCNSYLQVWQNLLSMTEAQSQIREMKIPVNLKITVHITRIYFIVLSWTWKYYNNSRRHLKSWSYILLKEWSLRRPFKKHFTRMEIALLLTIPMFP